jgi:hypothetical protein
VAIHLEYGRHVFSGRKKFPKSLDGISELRCVGNATNSVPAGHALSDGKFQLANDTLLGDQFIHADIVERQSQAHPFP